MPLVHVVFVCPAYLIIFGLTNLIIFCEVFKLLKQVRKFDWIRSHEFATSFEAVCFWKVE